MLLARKKRLFFLRSALFWVLMLLLAGDISFATPVRCHRIFTTPSESQVTSFKRGLLGNRDYLSQNWGRNVMHFKNDPEAFFEQLVPELKKVSDLFDPKIESQISQLENNIRKHIEKNGLSRLPGFAIRGVKPSGSLNRADYTNHLAATGYISEHGGNFFVFQPGKGSFSSREVQDYPSLANLFFAKLYASAGSAKRYAGGGDGTWNNDGKSVSAIAIVSLNEHFQVPINRGNDGIDGSYPYSFTTFGKVFHLSNLDVGNITRRRNPDGVPSENVAALIFGDALPIPLQGEKPESTALANLKEIAQTRWAYMQVLKVIQNLLVP